MKKNFQIRKKPHRIMISSLLLIYIFFASFNAFAIEPKSEIISTQQEVITVSGTIVDAKTGEALPGVSILIKGTSVGTITDLDGKYTIEANSNATLIYSFMGYVDKEILVNDQTVIDVTLEEDIIGLEEVVVVGYGVQKKSDLTGAVASVSSEKLNEMPVAGIDQALQGRAAGVSITQNTGMPGGDVSIQIRGITSINGTEPLVLVDGVRGNLSDLNPGDIASIEILKDASSAAIYGAAGGNGVILVTTKKGEEGKLSANLNYYFGKQKPWKKMNLMNAEEYAEAMNMLRCINGQELFLQPGESIDNYDWQDIMFRDASMQNWDLSVSGGTDKSTYFVSANYLMQDGILKNSDYDKLSIRANSKHTPGKLISLGENISFTKTKHVGYDEWMFQNEWNTPIRPILEMQPYLPPYDENGVWSLTPSGSANPKVDEDVLDRVRNKYTSGGNAYVDITPFKGLTLTSRINGYASFEIVNEFAKEYVYNASKQNPNNYVTKDLDEEYGWEFQNLVNYQANLNNHNIELMAGYEAMKTKHANMNGRRDFLINESEEMQYFDASTNDTLIRQIVKGGGWEQSAYATFGRLNYNYASKYLLTVNIRKDVSSRFGPDYNTGIFPSASIGWKFSEEGFMQNQNLISFGKLRIGYGQNGANAPERYAYYASISQTIDAYKYIFDGSTVSESGAALIKMPNREMRWEAVVMSNIGLDLAFIENQITLSVDLFEKHNDGMLISQTLPSYLGMYINPQWTSQFGGNPNPITNIGKISNKGVDISLGYKKVFGELTANFDLNCSFVKNEVVDLNGDSSLFRGNTGVDLKGITYTLDGHPVSQFWGYETDGLFTEEDAAINSKGKVYIINQPYSIKPNGDTAWMQAYAQPGDITFVGQLTEDTDGDGVPDAGDGKLNSQDEVFIGNPIPKFIFGFSTNLQYKGFDFILFLEGKLGHKLFNASKYWLMSQDSEANKLTDFLDQYHDDLYDLDNNLLYKANTNTDLPRIDPTGANANFTNVSDFYVESGNYVRLKNIQIGYTVPLKISQKAGIEKFRIYIGGTNQITLTKYKGFDPEIGNADILEQGLEKAGSYPKNKSWIIGLNLNF